MESAPRPASPRGLVALVVAIRSVPGAEAELADRLARLTVDVRGEPGNVTFSAWRHADEPGSFLVYEEYSDEDAFRDHLDNIHTRQFNNELTALAVDGGPRLTMLAELQAGDPHHDE